MKKSIFLFSTAVIFAFSFGCKEEINLDIPFEHTETVRVKLDEQGKFKIADTTMIKSSDNEDLQKNLNKLKSFKVREIEAKVLDGLNCSDSSLDKISGKVEVTLLKQNGEKIYEDEMEISSLKEVCLNAFSKSVSTSNLDKAISILKENKGIDVIYCLTIENNSGATHDFNLEVKAKFDVKAGS